MSPYLKRPPWRYPRDRLPSRATLLRWRKEGRRLAKKKGFKSSCDICKKPLNHFGRFKIWSPTTWRQAPKDRQLCEECWAVITEIVDVLEWLGAREDRY